MHGGLLLNSWQCCRVPWSSVSSRRAPVPLPPQRSPWWVGILIMHKWTTTNKLQMCNYVFPSPHRWKNQWHHCWITLLSDGGGDSFCFSFSHPYHRHANCSQKKRAQHPVVPWRLLPQEGAQQQQKPQRTCGPGCSGNEVSYDKCLEASIVVFWEYIIKIELNWIEVLSFFN